MKLLRCHDGKTVREIVASLRSEDRVSAGSRAIFFEAPFVRLSGFEIVLGFECSGDRILDEQVQVLLGEVEDMDPVAKYVRLADGATFEYDSLIVAAGSQTSNSSGSLSFPGSPG